MQQHGVSIHPDSERFGFDNSRWSVAKIVSIYLSFGFAWMLVTGLVLEFDRAAAQLQILFILLSAGLVAILGQRLTRNLEMTQSMLLEGERRYRQLAELLPQPVYEADADGRITFANRRAFMAFGFTGEDFARGINILNTVAPQDRERAHQSRTGLLSGSHQAGTATQYTVRRKDGSSFPAIVCTAPIFRKGRPVGTCGVVADISEQKKAEEELSREKRFVEAVIESLPGGFFMCDTDGRFIRWNRKLQELVGVTAEELAGMHFWEPYDGAERELIKDRFREVLGNGFAEAEATIVTKSGVSIPHHLSAILVEIDGRNYLLGVGLDITARKQAEAEISRLNQELEQRVADRTAELASALLHMESFSYSISHDLRAPLRAVDGFIQIIREDFSDQIPPEMQYHFQRISRNVLHMGNLIDDLLMFSRFSRQPLHKCKVQATEMVRDVLDELRDEQKNRQIELHIGDLPDCEADPTLLHQVLFNLLQNALKYTRNRDHATIEVNAWFEGKVPVYFVQDNGAGFDMRYSDKLFNVFQRLHGPEEFEGTGVGLAIVKNIIQRHGGKVWAEGAVNRGSTFYFTLDEMEEGHEFK